VVRLSTARPDCYRVREISGRSAYGRPRASALAPDEHSSWSTRWAWPP